MPAPDATNAIELTEPVDLCDDRGRLNPDAIGWSRQPLQRANLRGAYGRKKRWDYWCFHRKDLYVTVTFADVDYLGISSIWIYEPSSGFEVSVEPPSPFARGFHHVELTGVGTMSVRNGSVRLRLEDRDDATYITATGSSKQGPVSIDVRVDRPAAHESLNVVIPWSPTRFQFTSKSNTRTVTGTVSAGDRTWELGEPGDEPTYAALDIGRGIWKYRNQWNWASASGRGTGGELVGLQFGGKWTEGTGQNENALCVDGRLHKIHNELEWHYDWDAPMSPWRVTDPVNDLVDVTLTPDYDRYGKTSIGVLSMEVHQCFGTWAGRIVAESGETVHFDGLHGFAEEARNRW